MGSVDILLGLQWGDEGKGKIVDFLTPKYNVVARFQGGPNAGHTLEFDGKKHVLHQIPSGIFHDGILNIIGNGVVLDPITFKKEIEDLGPYNLDLKSSLFISSRAQLILPTHRLLDAAYEKSKGQSKIGSTLRGIGPTYQDKMARVGLRVGDILEKDFDSRVHKLVSKHCEILDQYSFEYDLEAELSKLFEAADMMRGFDIVNTEYLVNDLLNDDQNILAEGAQGSLLDIDFGSYPFVTSSNTISAAACTGLGVSPKRINDIFGIFKAYCTRVGSGPFPTELLGVEGEELRKKGNEFGATTGRPRRCGWLDIPSLKYACMLNGVTQLFMMKVDVLSGLSDLNICKTYNLEGKEITQIPLNYNEDYHPNLETIDGWEDIVMKEESDFPTALNSYITEIEELVNTPISLVSTGPDRTETIVRSKAVFSL